MDKIRDRALSIAELKDSPYWMTYKDKKPHAGSSTRNAVPCGSDDPFNYGTYDEAKEAAARHGMDGVGIAIVEPLAGIDIDDAFDDDGKIKPEAKKIIDVFDTYTEISPSGRGVHLLFKARKTPGSCKTLTAQLPSVEIYQGKLDFENLKISTSRYFTWTGNSYHKEPKKIEPRQAELDAFMKKYFNVKSIKVPNVYRPLLDIKKDFGLLKKAYNSKAGPNVRNLMQGITTVRKGQHEADSALCMFLLYFSDYDREQVDRIFRNSKLMREKWDDNRLFYCAALGAPRLKRTYRENTLLLAERNSKNKKR